jgi:hypothetical protein
VDSTRVCIRRLWLVVALLGSVACQANQHWLHLSGDAGAIGASVLVNGREVGLMKALTYRGSDSSSPVVRAREAKLLEEQVFGRVKSTRPCL